MDAGGARYRLGALSHVYTEAKGEPGQRTFRLGLKSGAATGSLWLEKEQLYQLAIHLQEIASSLPDTGEPGHSEAPEPEWTGGIANLDFKVGKLSLGHDASSNCFLVVAHDIEEPDETTATTSFWLTLQQGEELAKEAIKVCAAGRPKCFLCGQPVNRDGHICPRANGHTALQL